MGECLITQLAAPVVVMIDATSIPTFEGGVARYLRGLIAGLVGHHDRVTLHVVCKRADAGWVRDENPFAVVHVGPRSLSRPVLRLVWEQFGLPLLARRIGADVIHSPHYTMPLLATMPVVVTVHDATFFSLPKLHARLKAFFFRAWCRLSARRAAVLIAPSEATRDEICAHVGAPRGHFLRVYHGVSSARFHPPTLDEAGSFAGRHHLAPGEWIAFLGTIEPRKNLPNLIRAFESLAADPSPEFASLVLLLAGGPGWDDTVDKLIGTSPARERIVKLGYLADDELRPFLGGAACVAYPSLGEGFGLPVLEAMACGAAVLTTRSLALPEVGGDAVSYSGDSAESIEAGLRDLVLNPPRRAELAARAVRRADAFTWEKSALGHIEAYSLAANTKDRRAAAKPFRRLRAT